MALMRFMTKLLVCLLPFTNGNGCVDDTPIQDLSALFQSKNAQVLTASMPSNDAPIITADQTKVFVRPIVQKLAEMNATMTTLKALSVDTPEVNIVVNGMINSINTNIKPHIVTDHTDTQTLVDTTISTLSTRTSGAVEKKKVAVAADQALGQCYAEQRRLLVLNETCKSEEATLKGEKEITCTHINLYPKTYPLPADLKKDLTCNFSNGDCEDVRGARKNEHDTWLNGLNIVADKANYDSAHSACVAATLRWTNKIASCDTMWSNVKNKHAHCLYALKAQQLAICMFGDNLQSKCETKSNYDTLISDIEGTGNSDSTGDRASEWIAVNQLECMLTKFVGGAIFDNAMIADCTKNETDAKADFEEHVGILDKKTVEYESLITEANFNCAETAITFTGDKWSVPQGALTTHFSSAYTMVTGHEYAFDSDSNNAPFVFCASKSFHTTCGANFACGSESRKPVETTCYVDGGCTAAACCVKVAVCGDHVLDANEGCDDGSTAAMDGCSATCTIEAACEVPIFDNGVENWTGANCASGTVYEGTDCQITAAGGYTCTSPGVCGADGNFAAIGACQAPKLFSYVGEGRCRDANDAQPAASIYVGKTLDTCKTDCSAQANCIGIQWLGQHSHCWLYGGAFNGRVNFFAGPSNTEIVKVHGHENQAQCWGYS